MTFNWQFYLYIFIAIVSVRAADVLLCGCIEGTVDTNQITVLIKRLPQAVPSRVEHSIL